jgi:hypothetical protein
MPDKLSMLKGTALGKAIVIAFLLVALTVGSLAPCPGGIGDGFACNRASWPIKTGFWLH